MSHAKPVGEPAPFVNPADWPPLGPIDLTLADLPHASADTEWWYVNGHVNDEATGHDLSFFASFFRIVKGRDWQGNLYVGTMHTASECEGGQGSIGRDPVEPVRANLRVCALERVRACAMLLSTAPIRRLVCLDVCSSLLCVSVISLSICCFYSEHSHSLTWAIVDVTGGVYYSDPVLDMAAPEVMRKQLLDEPEQLDARMRRAFLEVVNKGTWQLE
jgi:hypothetical protein